MKLKWNFNQWICGIDGLQTQIIRQLEFNFFRLKFVSLKKEFESEMFG